jgi:hypothetical protein
MEYGVDGMAGMRLQCGIPGCKDPVGVSPRTFLMMQNKHRHMHPDAMFCNHLSL